MKSWKAKKTLESVIKNLRNLDYVQTMFKHDKQRLSDFYYPSSLGFGESTSQKSYKINSLSDITENRNVLIIGTIGQGKSMFMRHLCLQELDLAKRLPVFIELRYISEERDVSCLIKEKLASIGFFNMDDEILSYLLDSGIISIFLDGFDEIKRKHSLEVKKSCDILMVRHPNTRFVFSSRPGALARILDNNSSLMICRLMKLKDDDYRPFLEKLGRSGEHLDALIKSISASSMEIQGVLNTPLMMTLLDQAYGNSANIPDSLHYFYSALFNILVSKHDLQKDLYARERATSLNNLELQEVFECFAYLTKDHGVSISEEAFANCAKDASDVTRKKFTSEGLKSDLIEGVCLMQPEGLKTTYIHKSIQEYFAAAYIANQKEDDISMAIYEMLAASGESEWSQELYFLEKIDQTRFIKYYKIPILKQFLQDLKYFENRTKKITKANAKKYLGSIFHSVDPRQDEYQSNATWLCPSDSGKLNTVIADILNKVINFLELDRAILDHVKSTTNDLMSTSKFISANAPVFEDIYVSLSTACISADSEISRLETDIKKRGATARKILLKRLV